MASTPPPYTTNPHYQVAQQQTMPLSATPVSSAPSANASSPTGAPNTQTKRAIKLILPIVIVLALIVVMYFIWNTSTPAPLASNSSTTQQNFSNGTVSTSTSGTTGNGDIQVYIVGAVKHPGVYTLPVEARVYALLQAAGGPLPKANLVALNLAAKLTDGEEVYVTVIGEMPPTYIGGVPGPGTNLTGSPTAGQLVNINTASTDEMRQSLHLSSTTAQNIVNFRTQHGPFTSIDQLLQVVSKSIYDKIKALVTVS